MITSPELIADVRRKTMRWWAPLLARLDEAIRVVELRRMRRLMQMARLPFVYTVGVLMLAWVLIPSLIGIGGSAGGSLYQYAGAASGVHFALAGLAAGLAGYLRAQQIWHTERRQRSFHAWLLSYQEPPRVAVTTAVMAALAGLAITVAPVGVSFVVGIVERLRPTQLMLEALLIPICALFGGAAGAAAFFGAYALVPRKLLYPGLLVLAASALGLWVRIESVQGGWSGPWEQHPARIVLALALVTPVPALFGVASPAWWSRQVAPSLGLPVESWHWALIYGALLAAAGAYAALLAVRGYLELATDLAQIEERPRASIQEIGEEYYWKGFRNPVWTRDIRTRLRSKDTAEFIFFASIAVAAGAFVPLVLTARDLADPLATAKAARQVFFWLTMTLVALVALIAPGLTAEVITQEREMGTLEMLVGTPLRPREILMGKILGGACILLLLVTPSLPLFGLCYLFHGAAGSQVFQVWLLVLMTITVAAFIGVTQSSINAKAGSAKFFAYACTAVFVAFPTGPFWLAAAVAAPDASVRSQLAGQAVFSAGVAVFGIFFLGLFWGNACEQLQYSEY